MIEVCFACVHSAGRSQMSAAFFNALVDPARARATAAGTHPAARVHPEVVEAMAEVGIDLRHATPRLLDAALAARMNILVTLGCGEQCPVVPAAVERFDWPLADPKGQGREAVRAIRDEVHLRVSMFIHQRGWERK